MSPFWTGLFEELRGRGRNATLFIFAIAILFVLLLIAAQIPREVYVNYVLPVLPVVIALVGFGVVKTLLQARAHRRERLQRGPLSRDELNKARTKLVKTSAPQGFAAPPSRNQPPPTPL
jgi:4-amino-4-deoxy-L-arabinose transferase-like glycosyltransferase